MSFFFQNINSPSELFESRLAFIFSHIAIHYLNPASPVYDSSEWAIFKNLSESYSGASGKISNKP